MICRKCYVRLLLLIFASRSPILLGVATEDDLIFKLLASPCYFLFFIFSFYIFFVERTDVDEYLHSLDEQARLPPRATNCRKKKCGHTNQLRPKKKLK